MSKRGIWIMSGVAAAVLALFVGTSVDFPASGDKAAGTIVPAERYRAPQPGAEDIKLGKPGTEQRAPISPVPAGIEAAGASREALGVQRDAFGAQRDALGAQKDALGTQKDALGTQKDALGTQKGRARDAA